MKYNEISVFDSETKSKKKTQLNKNINSTQDILLSSTLDSFDSSTRPFIEKTLSSNPLLVKFDDTLPIKGLEQFIISYKGEKYSIGGLIINPSLKQYQKKKIIKTYFNDIVKEYNDSIKEEEVKANNIQELADAYEPKYVKFKRIITYLSFGLVFFFLVFKMDLLSQIPLIGKAFTWLDGLLNKSNPLKYIMFGLWVLQIIVFIIMNIITRIIKKKYDNFSKNTKRYISKIKKNALKKTNSIKTFYFKQIKNFYKNKDIQTYDIEKLNLSKINVESISEVCNDNVAKMVKTIKAQKRFYKSKFIWHLFAALSVIGLIACCIFM